MNGRILVVEDDADILRILSFILEEAGYQVIPAYGTEDAIRKMKLHRFDLVMTDLAMPKVSGVEVIEAVKTDPQMQHIPVIAVTAHMWEELAQAAANAGCDGYIAKPFNNRQVVLEVQKQLSKRSRTS